MQIDLVTSARWQASEPETFHGKIRLSLDGTHDLRTELRFTATWIGQKAPCKVSVRRRDGMLFETETDLAKEEMLSRPGNQDEITFLADVVMPAILGLLHDIGPRVDPSINRGIADKDITFTDARSIRIESADDSIVRHTLIGLLKMDTRVARPRG
jgi:hypothetical protein